MNFTQTKQMDRGGGDKPKKWTLNYRKYTEGSQKGDGWGMDETHDGD